MDDRLSTGPISVVGFLRPTGTRMPARSPISCRESVMMVAVPHARDAGTVAVHSIDAFIVKSIQRPMIYVPLFLACRKIPGWTRCCCLFGEKIPDYRATARKMQKPLQISELALDFGTSPSGMLHFEKKSKSKFTEFAEKFRGMKIALLRCGAVISPREQQRFVPKQGRAAETVGPPNVRLQR